MIQTKRGAPIRLALLLLILGLGLALRVTRLDNRPMHADEAVHAVKFRDLWLSGTYQYDPNEYHGPTIYYAALPSVWTQGRRDFGDLREADLRLGVAVTGAAMVLLLALVADALGWSAVLFCALFLAVSPAFVFYSRYFIQEVPFVAYTLGMIVSGWRHAQNPRVVSAAATGLFAGLMIATKETSVVTFVAAAMAITAVRAGRRRFRRAAPDGVGGSSEGTAPRAGLRYAAIGAATALFVGALLLSNFFRNPSALADYARAYAPWFGRAHRTDLHQHPWHYYLGLLTWNRSPGEPLWTEAFLLGMGAIGLLAAIAPRRFRLNDSQAEFTRFLAVFTLVLLFVYSAIPYKTPWNMLSFLLGIVVLAGIGAAALVRAFRPAAARVFLAVVILAGSVHLGMQSCRAAFINHTGGGNPYAYSQTLPDVLDLGKRVEEIAKANKGLREARVDVVASDGYYWPLPWYLRRLEKVGFWNAVPDQALAPVVIASPDLDAAITARLPDHVMIGFTGMRPGVAYMTWVRMDVWERYLKARPKPADTGE